MKTFLKGIAAVRRVSRTRFGSRRDSCEAAAPEVNLLDGSGPSLTLRPPEAPPQPLAPQSPATPRDRAGQGWDAWDPTASDAALAALLAQEEERRPALFELTVDGTEEPRRQRRGNCRPLNDARQEPSRPSFRRSNCVPFDDARQRSGSEPGTARRQGCHWASGTVGWGDELQSRSTPLAQPASPVSVRSPPVPLDDTSSDAAIAALIAEMPRTPSPSLTPRFLPPEWTPERTFATRPEQGVAARRREEGAAARRREEDDAFIAAALAGPWGVGGQEDLIGAALRAAAESEERGVPVSRRPSNRRPRSPRRPPPRPPPAQGGLQAEPGDDGQASRPAGPGEETCVACLESAADALLVPCGHINLCVPCAGKLNPPRCPVCRLTVQQVVRTKRRPKPTPAPAAPAAPVAAA